MGDRPHVPAPGKGLRKVLNRVVAPLLAAALCCIPFAGNAGAASPAQTRSVASAVLEPSECLGAFDVWAATSDQHAVIAYYGSSLPVSGTLYIYISSWSRYWGTWGVSKSTSYDAKAIYAAHSGEYLLVRLYGYDGALSCEGAYYVR